MYFGWYGVRQIADSHRQIMVAFMGKRAREKLRAPSWRWASTECQRSLACPHGQSQHNVAIMVYIHHSECHCMLQGPRILSGSFVNDIHCYRPGGGGGNIPSLSAYKGCHLLVYEWLGSNTTHMTTHARPIIIDDLLTLIFKIGYGAFRFLYWL